MAWLNREQAEMVRFVVLATDNGPRPLTGDAMVLVHVADVDEPPTFTHDVYEFEILENQPIGASSADTVTQIRASVVVRPSCVGRDWSDHLERAEQRYA